MKQELENNPEKNQR